MYRGRALTPQIPTPSKISAPRFNRKVSFYTGLFLGSVLGGIISADCNFVYFFITSNGLYTVKISADGKPLWAG